MNLRLRRQLPDDPGGTTTFLLHVRIDAAPAERDLIRQFRLGEKELVDTPMRVETLIGAGQTLRFDDFEAMLEVEGALRRELERFAGLFRMAAKFQPEEVVELATGEAEPAGRVGGAAAGSGWQPILTAPLGTIVLLWHRQWRHPFPGRRTGDHGAVWVDNCEPVSFGWETFATHWLPLPTPPGSTEAE
jgi:hypothetical protein